MSDDFHSQLLAEASADRAVLHDLAEHLAWLHDKVSSALPTVQCLVMPSRRPLRIASTIGPASLFLRRDQVPVG